MSNDFSPDGNFLAISNSSSNVQPDIYKNNGTYLFRKSSGTNNIETLDKAIGVALASSNQFTNTVQAMIVTGGGLLP